MTVEREIRRRIRERGCISFAEFMELALFWPQGGYYLQRRPIGASGDFYTSPHAHPAFGALLSVQLHQMWLVMGEPDPFTVVELGAGDGLLCRDLINYSIELPGGFGRSLRYLCLDTKSSSGRERELQQASRGPVVDRIAALLPPMLGGQGNPPKIPLRGIRGCFLSNEFLDAFPVHQVTMSQGALKEVYVTLRNNRLEMTLGEPSTFRLAARLEALGIGLAEGQTVEISLGTEVWTEQVADALESGFVLTIDYGRPALELYSAEHRPRGTLTTFYQHTQTDSPLQRIGDQDITAQVDFTTVIDSGKRAGLEPLGYASQSSFLANLGLAQLRRRLTSLGLPQRQFIANNAGMLDLIRPGGLGDFKVLAQGKNVGHPALWGFEATGEAPAITERAPAPLLRMGYLPLAEARYPHVELEFDASWPIAEDLPESGHIS